MPQGSSAVRPTNGLFLPLTQKLYKSFSLPLLSVLHVKKYWPSEKLRSIQRSIKFHALKSLKPVALFLALGSQFRGDKTHSYYLQDITYYDVWVSSVGIKYLQSLVRISLGSKIWNNDKQFLVNKTNRYTEFQFYWYYNSTCFRQPFCPSSVLSRTLDLLYFMQLWCPFATRSRMERQFHLAPGSKRSS